MPAIKAWPKGLSEVPSSLGLTMIALRPANRPESTRTTLPCFIILPIFLAAEQFSVVTPQENLKEKEDISVTKNNKDILGKFSRKRQKHHTV